MDPFAGKDPVSRLLAIMERLRGEDGCPWDRQQTPESLRPYVIEEAHELVEAITSGTPEEVREELGDVLLQVVFHSQIARERGLFDFAAVAGGIGDKLLRRHPHVFGGEKAADAEEALRSWERIKAEKEGKTSRKRERHLPALHRAMRVQEKAAGLGFDWEEPGQLLDKLAEEVAETREAVARGDRAQVRDEVGDLLFMAVNIARFLEIHPDDALEGALEKFDRRWGHMERRAAETGRELAALTLAEMEELWQEAKRLEKAGGIR